MDICSWDWGAIGSIVGAVATFYAARVAICIANKWRIQKKTEVRAIEARKLLDYLFELKSMFYKRYNIYQDKDNIAISTDDKSKEKIKILISNITILLNFLNLQDDSDQFISNLKSIENDLDIEDLAKRTLKVSISYQTTNKYENVNQEIDRLICISKKIAQYDKL